ncbi:MAG: hypothetical protein J1E38_09480 [Paramuribaculum sp.]|nr:hypothetical protein [Paramuribaculum sp.]
MNCRKLTIFCALIIGLCLTGCNTDDSGWITIEDPSAQSVEVKSFKISKNGNIVANVDSVFFSIDLANARIYNADSLPVGTVVGKVVLEIETATVSKSEIVFKTSEGTDTVIDYLEHSTDSVDFSYGPVSLRLVSYDQQVVRNYSIEVNVHQSKPDTLTWGNEDFDPLPSELTAPKQQKTVVFNDKFYCLSSADGSYSLGVCENPATKSWETKNIAVPTNSDTQTFTSTDDALYIIADGTLYRSDDECESWYSTGSSMNYIYGGYGTTVLGVVNTGGSFMHVTYPESTTKQVAANCPVSGTSTPLVFSSEWSSNPMFMVMGGKTASGSLTGSVWAYDGFSWSAISISPVPAWEGAIFYPYYTISVNNQWVTTLTDVLVASGGRLEDGTISDIVYISRDRGIHWALAPAYMQKPVVADDSEGEDEEAEAASIDDEDYYIDQRYGAQAYVANYTLHTPASRVAAPIVDWSCPYIYVFGGYNQSDELGGVRRGVLNYFTFIPIY